MNFNQDNFFIASKANFTASARPTREPDFVSGQGEGRSEYWYVPGGVIRCSNHWSRINGNVIPVEVAFECDRVRFCWWTLDATNFPVPPDSRDYVCGFCKWRDFLPNPRGYKMYLKRMKQQQNN